MSGARIGRPEPGASLLLVGNEGGTNVGWSLHQAALAAGHRSVLVDARAAHRGARWWRAVNWHLRGHRPAELRAFSARVLAAVDEHRPDVVLTTGAAPVDAATLRAVRGRGAACVNFSTDDPWNPTMRAAWFLRALPEYDVVFTPRRSNMDDLRRLGCGQVEYLPFGYDPRHCHPEPVSEAERVRLACDLLFVGGADRDRAPVLGALARSGAAVAAYGDYWDRYPETRALTRGHADPGTLRRATAAAAVALCLVRRSNRDGHVMRSLEIPAIGACMLVEDTPDHREIFGPDGETAAFFADEHGMLARLRELLGDPEERARLARAAHRRIVGGGNTYADRLTHMLGAVEVTQV